MFCLLSPPSEANKLTWQLNTRHIEDNLVTPTPLNRRREVRVDTALEAQLHAHEQWGNGRITNLSLGGLQLECSFQVLEAMMPNIQRPDPHRPLEIEIQFELDTPTGLQTVLANCSMLYARRIAQNRFVIGGRFTGFTKHSRDALMSFLMASLPDHTHTPGDRL